jgi:hypothetical protein
MLRQSEIPRTSSAFPTLSRYEPVVGAAAATASLMNGVCQICMVWTRVASSWARNTTILPSSKML